MARTNRPARILSAEQEAEMLRKERIVMDLRIQGLSFYRIEQETGFANCDRIWKRAMGRAENDDYRRAEAIRLEEERLDVMQEGLWGRILAGEPRAVEVGLKVLERRARMLGLDHADAVAGQLVEIEAAKVSVMANSLVAALGAIGASRDQVRVATAAFMADLRARRADEEYAGAAAGDVVPGAVVLTDDDRSLL